MGVASVLLSSIGVELATDPLAGAEREAAQRLIARSWQRYLESLAEGAPLVALIDDVHWADPSLLELLESVVARASGADPRAVHGATRPVRATSAVGRRTLERDDDLPVRALARRRLAADRTPPGRSRARRGRRADPRSIRGQPVLRGRAAPDDDRGLDDRPPRRPLGARPRAPLPAARHRAGRHRVAHRPAGTRGEARDPGRVGDRADLLARRRRPPGVGGRRARDRGVGRQGSRRRTRHVDDRGRARVHCSTTSSRAMSRTGASRGRGGRRRTASSAPGWRRARRDGPRSSPRSSRITSRSPATRAIGPVRADRRASACSACSPPRRPSRGSTARWTPGRSTLACGRRSGWPEGWRRSSSGGSRTRSATTRAPLVDAREAGDAEGEARALAAIAHTLWLLDRYDEGGALLPEALERARAVGLGRRGGPAPVHGRDDAVRPW